MIGLVYSDESEANSFMKIVTKKKGVFGAYGCLVRFCVSVVAHWKLVANLPWLRAKAFYLYMRHFFSSPPHFPCGSRILLTPAIHRQAQNGDHHQEEVKKLEELED